MTAKPWCYDTLLPSVRAKWDTHDPGCESLRWFWLGRQGGVSSPGDLWSCDGDCDATFFIEGVPWVNYPDEDELRLCACCARQRGYRVIGVTDFGIRVESAPPSPSPERSTQP